MTTFTRRTGCHSPTCGKDGHTGRPASCLRRDDEHVESEELRIRNGVIEVLEAVQEPPHRVPQLPPTIPRPLEGLADRRNDARPIPDRPNLKSPGQQTAQLATNLATMGAGLAYASEAKKVDPPAATIVAPYVSWMAFANLITEELWRRNIRRKDVR